MTLPKGWERVEVPRKSGLSKGKIDIKFNSPNGTAIRPKTAMIEYIKKNNLKYNIEDFNFSTKKTLS